VPGNFRFFLKLFFKIILPDFFFAGKISRVFFFNFFRQKISGIFEAGLSTVNDRLSPYLK